MKKTVLLTCLIAGTIYSIFAAGTKDSSGKNIKLTIAGRDGSYGDALQLAADSYTAKHPGVSFEILKLSGNDLFEKSVIDMKTGTGTYDIILIDDTNITLFQQAGWLTNLDKFGAEKDLDADIIEPAVRLGRWPYAKDGKLEAVPLYGNVALFAYRKDLFEKYGNGNCTTWESLIENVKKITAQNPAVTGVVFRGVKGNPIVTGFLPIFWAYGGNILDASGKVTMNTSESLAAMNCFLELAKYAPKDVATYQSSQVRDALYSGSAAVAAEVWPGWIGDLENPAKSAVVGKVAVVKSPGEKVQTTSMLGVWLAGIPEESRNKKAAYDFMKYLLSKEIQEQVSDKAGVPPVRKSVFEESSQTAKYPWYPAQKDALEHGVARPRSANWKQMEDALGNVLQRALIGELTASQAVNQAQADLSKIAAAK